MSDQEVFIGQFTRIFHHYGEALSTNLQPVDASAGSLSSDDNDRLFAAARLAIQELEMNASLQADSRQYFAKPGEAEWGC